MANIFLQKIKSIISSIICFIPVLIYDLVISRFLTISSHNFFLNQFLKKDEDARNSSSLLDIGAGTGKPLFTIIKEIPQQFKRVLAIDIDRNYTKAAQKLFKKFDSVEVRLQNFYDFDKIDNEKFDIIFFSFSFMLMPDKQKAIQIAEKLLKKNGNIMFLLTLNKRKIPLLEKLKPLIKYFFTVDFGEVVYENQFQDLIQQSNLQIIQKTRVSHKCNIPLKLFHVYLIQCKVKPNLQKL